MEFICPTCHASLEVQGQQTHCAHCDKTFTLEPRCPECHKPLEVLTACGAVPERSRPDVEKAGGVVSAGE